jgi:hypothetical protein
MEDETWSVRIFVVPFLIALVVVASVTRPWSFDTERQLKLHRRKPVFDRWQADDRNAGILL